MSAEPESIHVLHVDDDLGFADMVATFLTRENPNFVVDTASSISEATTRFRDNDIEYDCIVSDYELPGETGIEFLKTVRKTHSDLPFILFTGRGSEEVASDAISAGVTDYLQKEHGTDQYQLLANRIQNYVSHTQTRVERDSIQEQIELALEYTDSVIFEIDLDTGEVRRVGDFEHYFKHTKQEVPTWQDHLEHAVHPDDKEGFRRFHQQLITGDRDAGVLEYRTAPDTGDVRWIQDEVYVQEGESRTAIGLAQDITERKKHEHKLTALHDFASDLSTMDSHKKVCERTIQASQDILEFDLSIIALEDTGILRPIAVSEQMPPEDFGEKSIHDGIAGKSYQYQKSYLIRDMAEHDDAEPGGPYESGISVPIGDHGNFQVIAETPRAFTEDDLKLVELLISHTKSALDQIDQKQRLEKQNERLDEFASVISHDLRNPLNVVQGRIDLAREECDTEHLEPAANAVDRSLSLLGELLTLARRGQQVSDLEPVDLTTVINSGWQNIDTGNASISVKTDARILADETRLQQLVENLFQNAIIHGGDNVAVTVDDISGGFYVADDGPGIPDDVSEQVFEPGFSMLHDGTGFGLSIVNQIVEGHDWNISIEDSEAGGAQVQITGITFVEDEN